VSSFGFMLLHKERAEGEAARLATMDPLTGAYNRRTFHEIAERELSRARRAGQPLSIIVLDIDHFRAVNERHGNRVGDLALQCVADLARGALRKEDMLVRYGGEEFLVLLPGAGLDDVAQIGERIRRAVGETSVVEGEQRISVTVSLGGATYGDGAASAEQLVARADAALYGAKAEGRNRLLLA
jgi:diguanylate cyclase (GGDEF)-like protein